MDFERHKTSYDAVIEVNGNQFEALRQQESTLVIDVREIGEIPLLANFNTEQMPMSRFRNMISNIREENIILICQHGIRSLHAAELLQKEFGRSKKLYSLKGGIVRWMNLFIK